ncbi:uncharacterized protein LOC128892672 isoform X2 [Hylaeus anthracinus]|uniref:uncharacterized protein LOC128892671 isoform X2 n=1 Tax=Hylaeus anthracinus TaxID=313031 RepID=UPI0023B8C455|nr:uncharacterized protein LOC128892671 isoform X2 [Hylaeus anthracinus]XP_054009184.1 uncharacterized protein LOC128892672 isoform X2 [Hylaeus anthracinus]
MRQVVVLEPAGSVLVIRQTSLGGNVTTGNTNSNAGSNNVHETHGLANHAAVSTIASNDHNQNRIVVVRSSSSTCMTTTADNHVSANSNGNVNVNANLNGNAGGIVSKTSSKVGVGTKVNERNDHLRNDHKSQDGIGTGESNSGCRPRTSKEAAHENVSLDRKLDGADPISGKYFRRYLLLPLTDQPIPSVNYLFLHRATPERRVQIIFLRCLYVDERRRHRVTVFASDEIMFDDRGAVEGKKLNLFRIALGELHIDWKGLWYGGVGVPFVFVIRGDNDRYLRGYNFVDYTVELHFVCYILY